MREIRLSSSEEEWGSNAPLLLSDCNFFEPIEGQVLILIPYGLFQGWPDGFGEFLLFQILV